jgi:hypothetical protein
MPEICEHLKDSCVTVSNFAQFHQACCPKLSRARDCRPYHDGRSGSFGLLGKAHRPRNAADGLAQTGPSNVGTV